MSTEKDGEDPEIIRSVTRSLELLEYVSIMGSASVQRLSQDLGLAKATAVRMIRTLMHAGYICQVSHRGEYSVTSKMCGLASNFSGMPAVLDAGKAIVDQLTADIWWPLALAERAGEAMTVRYSTIPASPYAHARSTIGKVLPLWTSAHGKANLAFSDASQRPSIPDDVEQGMSKLALEAELQQVVARGFATRSFGRDPVTNTIAVPIRQSGMVIATLGMTFFTKALKKNEIYDLAERLKNTASCIENRMDNLQQSPKKHLAAVPSAEMPPIPSRLGHCIGLARSPAS